MERWEALSTASTLRKVELQHTLDELRRFEANFEQLRTWLNQKQKMVVALGPLATDPAMIQHQLTQVQVLQEEMDQQQVAFY